MRIESMARRFASAALAGALAACCVPAGALAAEQNLVGSDPTALAAVQEASDSFDSQVGLSHTRWAELPSVKAAWENLHGSGATTSSLASFRKLFQAVCACGTQLLGAYAGGAPVLLEDGHHYRMGAEGLAAAEDALSSARAAAKANTTTAYYDQSRTVIGAVNAALCSVEAAPDADALKLIWDSRALEQIDDEAAKAIALPKGSKATAKSSSLVIAAPLSQSGAAASFSKEGGSSKIIVSKSGKCTLKKGTKKGRYSAQVSVAYSKITAKKVIVIFVVS